LWLQLDAAVAWVASNVSNPFFAPALLTAEVQIGAWVRTGAPLRLGQELSRSGGLRHFIGYMFVGAPLVGSALALCGGAITFGAMALLPKGRVREPYRLPPNAPAWLSAVEKVARRFASPNSPRASERTRFHYLRAKLLADPVAKMVAEIAGGEPSGFGEMLDIGTGRGQLPLLLLELGRATSVRGVDWDARKVAEAQRAALGETEGMTRLNAVFVQGDVRTTGFGSADTILLIDLLHYFAVEEQNAILDRAVAAVRPGGRLLVREADRQRGWRSFLTLVEEQVFTLVRFNRGERVCFRAVAEITARMESRGLQCVTRPAWGRTPFSNLLVVGRRQPSTTKD
jgi:SAM-dependent methyltransferase